MRRELLVILIILSLPLQSSGQIVVGSYSMEFADFNKDEVFTWNIDKFDVDVNENITLEDYNPIINTSSSIMLEILNNTDGVEFERLSLRLPEFFNLTAGYNQTDLNWASLSFSFQTFTGFHYDYRWLQQTDDYNITAYISIFIPLMIPLYKVFDNGTVTNNLDSFDQSLDPSFANVSYLNENSHYYDFGEGNYMVVDSSTGLVTAVNRESGILDYSYSLITTNDPVDDRENASISPYAIIFSIIVIITIYRPRKHP